MSSLYARMSGAKGVLPYPFGSKRIGAKSVASWSQNATLKLGATYGSLGSYSSSYVCLRFQSFGVDCS